MKISRDRTSLKIGDLIRHETWPNEYFFDVVIKVHYIEGLPCYFYTAKKIICRMV